MQITVGNRTLSVYIPEQWIDEVATGRTKPTDYNQLVQLILNPAYLPIVDVSEIGLFGEILPDESIGVLIQPFLPRMVRAAKIGFRLQCFDYFGVLVELFAVIHGDGMDSGFICF